MKQILIFCLLAAALFAPATDVQAQRYFDISKTDTLSNQDTIIVTTATNSGPTIIETPYYFSAHVMADSLSGANAGTAYLQFCNDRTGTNWYNAQTLTIDGTTTSSALWEGILYARRARVYFITPSGTRSVKVQVYASFKKMQ